jgi:hypothetical protein
VNSANWHLAKRTFVFWAENYNLTSSNRRPSLTNSHRTGTRKIWNRRAFGQISKGRILVFENHNIKVVWNFAQVLRRGWAKRALMAWRQKSSGVAVSCNRNPFPVEWVLPKLSQWRTVSYFSKVRFSFTGKRRCRVIKVMNVTTVK